MFPIHTSIVNRHVAVATWLLIGVNSLVFFLELRLPEEILQNITYLFGVVPARFVHPEWAQSVGFPIDNYWPYITSLFLHGGWLHVFGNMWTLWLFGRNVEDRMGSIRFLLFYLVCGISAGIVHTLVNSSSTVPAIGASGAIAGVLGAYLAMFPSSRVVVMIPVLFFPFFFEMLAVFYLVFWFLIQFFSGAIALASFSPASGGIAFWAHIGGFVTGAIIFALFLRPRVERRPFQLDEGDIEHAWSRLR